MKPWPLGVRCPHRKTPAERRRPPPATPPHSIRRLGLAPPAQRLQSAAPGCDHPSSHAVRAGRGEDAPGYPPATAENAAWRRPANDRRRPTTRRAVATRPLRGETYAWAAPRKGRAEPNNAMHGSVHAQRRVPLRMPGRPSPHRQCRCVGAFLQTPLSTRFKNIPKPAEFQRVFVIRYPCFSHWPRLCSRFENNQWDPVHSWGKRGPFRAGVDGCPRFGASR